MRRLSLLLGVLAVTFSLIPSRVQAQCKFTIETPAQLPDASVGTPYSQVIKLNPAGVYTFKFDARQFAPGTTLNTKTGAVEGTPTESGKYSFPISISDGSCEITQTFGLIVSSCAIEMGPLALAPPVVGVKYVQALEAKGSEPYTFSVTSGSLPSGLVIEGSSIIGIPTSPSNGTSFTIGVKDARGCIGSRAYTVSVSCPTITLGALPRGAVGVAYWQSIVSGTTASFTAAVIDGSLPPGLTLASNGVVSGTPTAGGSFTFVIEVRQGECKASRTYTVTICPVIKVDPPSATANIGFAYSGAFAAAGGTAPYTFSSTGTFAQGLTFNADTGVLSGTPTTEGTFTSEITILDASKCGTTVRFTMTVACPNVAVGPASVPNGTTGTPYKTVTFAATGGIAPYEYSAAGDLPPGLILKGDQLGGTPTTAGSYKFAITAKDLNGCSDSQTYIIDIVAGCPTISVTGTLPGGTAGSDYKAGLSASGGVSPYTFTVTGGALPPGLTLDGGIIIGTPSTPGDYSFTITATDSNRCSGSAVFRMSIGKAACPTITVGPSTLAAGTIGAGYKAALSASGGAGPYKFALSSGSLPKGLLLDSDGVISGTPLAVESVEFSVTATDANGCTGTGSHSIKITEAPCPSITVGPSTLANGKVATAYRAALTATGGTSPHTFSITSGTLPPGITLTGETISGTPTTVGQYAFTVTAKDARGCSGALAYVIEIGAAACPAITVGPSTLSNGNVGVAYRAIFTASGGKTPYSFNLAAGTLPPGLTLSGDTLSGVPTAGGEFKFAIAASDVNRCIGSTTYVIAVTEACPTSTASPTAPAAGATFDGTRPIVFAWNAAEGAKSYDVLVSTDSLTFSSVASTTGTTASASLAAGSYVWAVRANFGLECKPTISTPTKLTIAAGSTCPTAKAALVSPANGATGVEQTVLFQWRGVADAVDYTLALSVNGGAATKVATTTGTELKFDVPEGTIAWTIVTSFKGCPATVSDVFTFKTKVTSTCPTNPPAAVLRAPADGATNVTSPVTFSWGAVSGASEYRLYTWQDGVANIHSTTGTSFEAKFGAGTVIWLVESVFSNCRITSLSDKRSFTVGTGSTCQTTEPVLLSPANTAAGVVAPVTFSWNAVPNAIAYELHFAVDSDRLVKAVSTRDTKHTQDIAGAGRVLWQVVALFSGCDFRLSPIWSFTLEEPVTCPDGAITLVAPANGSTVPSPVTFSWTGIAGATKYRVLYSVNGAASILESTTTSVTAPSIESGIVTWVVEAQFGSECKSIVSDPGRFEVQAANTCETNRPPVLESPLGSPDSPVEFTNAVQLRWAPSAGATSYRAWISFNGGALEDIETTSTSIDRKFAAGDYSWFVTAQFPGCPPLPSAKGYFRVRAAEARCGDETPAIISPADGASGVDSNITFLWSSVPNAIAYRVYARADRDNITDEFKLIEETKQTSTVEALPPGGYIWYVEAVFRECSSTFSPRAMFSVRESANCRQESPDPVSPRDGAQSVSSPVQLVWTPVSGAIKYVVFARLQDGDASPIGATDGATSLTRHMPPGETIEWYVVALRAGCDPVQSRSATFSVAGSSCDAKPPAILSPSSRSTVSNPVHLAWTYVPGVLRYAIWTFRDGEPVLLASLSTTEIDMDFPVGTNEWFVEAVFENCQPLRSSTGVINVEPPQQSCATPSQPSISVVGQVLSNTPYSVRWTGQANVSVYELQESKSRNDFSSAETFIVEGRLRRSFHHVADNPTQRFYRVRAVSKCSDEKGPFSNVVGVHIIPVNAIEQQTPGTAEIGVQDTVVQTVFVPGGTEPITFTAHTDKPWLTVTPASGVLPPEGLTFTITADPSALSLGANTGTLSLVYGSAGKRETTNGSTTANIPVSVSLVTPVGVGGKNTPLSESLIIPAVGHAPGANNALFQSDVRIANTSTQSMTYQLNFTPSRTDGTVSGSSTSIQVNPGATVALNDILASFFGTGPDGSAIGVLEIRPSTTSTTSTAVSSTSALASPTVASSRTYNVTSVGTLGQYIPAVPFSKFVGLTAGSARPVLSMQQIAESSEYRTNLGLVEGSGQPVSLLIRVFDAAGNLIGEMPESLQPFEHKQLNSIVSSFGVQLNDGRIEVEPTSGDGRVTAYASRQDNQTNDPLLIQPVVKNATQSTRYVVPGVAFIDGLAKWRSDVRIFNAGSSPTTATLTYFPQGNPAAAMTKEITIEDGQVMAFDNVLNNFFGITAASAGGSLLVTTPAPSSLVATARTYADSDTGTYGLFAPGVTPEEAVGAGERSLNLLQLEESSEFRTNIGIFETAGRDATVEVSLILPDSKVNAKIQFPLPANGFVQFPLAAFNVGNAVYNARAVVRVTTGSGRVSAYGSVIDWRTNDSTYVPAQ